MLYVDLYRLILPFLQRRPLRKSIFRRPHGQRPHACDSCARGRLPEQPRAVTGDPVRSCTRGSLPPATGAHGQDCPAAAGFPTGAAARLRARGRRLRTVSRLRRRHTRAVAPRGQSAPRLLRSRLMPGGSWPSARWLRTAPQPAMASTLTAPAALAPRSISPATASAPATGGL